MSATLLGIAIVLVAIFVNGIVATIEDELPGGFDNPQGDQPLSPFSRRWLRVGRMIGIITVAPLGLIAAWGIRASLAEAQLADRALAAGVAAGATTLAVAIVLRRRRALWAAAAMIGAGLLGGVVLR